MEKCLLSVDWDYFINTGRENWGSYLENKRNVIALWYKRYIQSESHGRDIQQSYLLSEAEESFWSEIKEHFKFIKGIKAFVSDSHALSYDIAKENDCKKVYLFDAHSDLGYGGISSLNFEVNCANWLGLLLKNRQIREADIIYSPYTAEEPEYFKSMNDRFNIRYVNFDELDKEIEVSAVHVARSGAWTPPWLDEKFAQFLIDSGLEFEVRNCPPRKWDPKHMSFSDEIYYRMA